MFLFLNVTDKEHGSLYLPSCLTALIDAHTGLWLVYLCVKVVMCVRLYCMDHVLCMGIRLPWSVPSCAVSMWCEVVTGALSGVLGSSSVGLTSAAFDSCGSGWQAPEEGATAVGGGGPSARPRPGGSLGGARSSSPFPGTRLSITSPIEVARLVSAKVAQIFFFRGYLLRSCRDCPLSSHSR